MKKVVWLFSVILVVIAAGMLRGQGTAVQESQFIMIQWVPATGQVMIHKGVGKEIEGIDCKGFSIQNCVLDLLGQLKSKGYKVLEATYGQYSTGPVDRNGHVILLGKD